MKRYVAVVAVIIFALSFVFLSDKRRASKRNTGVMASRKSTSTSKQSIEQLPFTLNSVLFSQL